MEFDEALKTLEESKEFISWQKTAKKAYLAHGFKMFDELNKKIWQIGYFNPDTYLITVFVINGGKIEKNPDSEVFQDQKKLVNKLNTKEVKIKYNEAYRKAEEVLSKEYKNAAVFKSFMILQNLDEFGQIWNITFVTNQFKTINVKINAKTGDCSAHKEVSLIADQKKE